MTNLETLRHSRWTVEMAPTPGNLNFPNPLSQNNLHKNAQGKPGQPRESCQSEDAGQSQARRGRALPQSKNEQDKAEPSQARTRARQDGNEQDASSAHAGRETRSSQAAQPSPALRGTARLRPGQPSPAQPGRAQDA